MRVFFIGFGQAGGKIVDMFIEQDKKLGTNSFRGIAVNTARTDLMGLKNIEMKDRILIGQTLVKGHGVGTDNVTGARVTADEIDSIINAVDTRGTHDVDAFVIVAGLGGGTGQGDPRYLLVISRGFTGSRYTHWALFRHRKKDGFILTMQPAVLRRW